MATDVMAALVAARTEVARLARAVAVLRVSAELRQIGVPPAASTAGAVAALHGVSFTAGALADAEIDAAINRALTLPVVLEIAALVELELPSNINQFRLLHTNAEALDVAANPTRIGGLHDEEEPRSDRSESEDARGTARA